VRTKHVAFLALILLLPWVSACTESGAMPVTVLGGGVTAAGGYSCPSATYLSHYDMDHGTGTNYLCENDGGADLQGTQSGGTISASYGQSGNGFRSQAKDTYVEFVSDAEDICDKDVGTVWMSVRLDTLASDSSIWEFVYDATNQMSMSVRADGKIQFYYCANSVSDGIRSDATFAIADSNWYRIGASWDNTVGTGSSSATVGVAAWKEDTNEEFGTWQGTPDAMAIGENASVNSQNFTGQDISIDNVRCIGSYQAADPGV